MTTVEPTITDLCAYCRSNVIGSLFDEGKGKTNNARRLFEYTKVLC